MRAAERSGGGHSRALGCVVALLCAAACAGEGGDAPVDDAICGDGVVEAEEACDDGDDDPHDGCNDLCTIPGSVAWTYAEASPIHGYISGHGIAVDPDEGALYVVGAIAWENVDDRFRPERQDAMLRKLTRDGEPLWIATQREKYGGYAYAVALTGGGDPVVGGRATPPNISFRVWTSRYSRDGAVLWAELDWADNVKTNVRAIARLRDGSFALTGDNLGSTSAVVRRMSASGELSDVEGRINSPLSGAGRALVAAEGGVFTEGGRLFLAGVADHRALVAAYTHELELLWMSTGDIGEAEAVAVVDGDVVVAGRSDFYDEGADEARTERWIERRSGADGALIWRRALDDARAQAVHELAGDRRGALVVAGEYGLPTPTAWIAKLDGDGAAIWQAEEPLAEVQAAGGETHAYAVAVGEDDRIYVAGTALDALGYYRVWVQERAP